MSAKSPIDWKASLGSLLPDGYTPQEPERDDTSQPSQKKYTLRIEIDRKRAGKTATIISGFGEDDNVASDTAALLKRKLGVGGSARGGEILLQGDCRQAAAKALKDILKPEPKITII